MDKMKKYKHIIGLIIYIVGFFVYFASMAFVEDTCKDVIQYVISANIGAILFSVGGCILLGVIDFK